MFGIYAGKIKRNISSVNINRHIQFNITCRNWMCKKNNNNNSNHLLVCFITANKSQLEASAEKKTKHEEYSEIL